VLTLNKKTASRKLNVSTTCALVETVELPTLHVIQLLGEKSALKGVHIVNIVTQNWMNACAPTVALLRLAAVPENAENIRVVWKESVNANMEKTANQGDAKRKTQNQAVIVIAKRINTAKNQEVYTSVSVGKQEHWVNAARVSPQPWHQILNQTSLHHHQPCLLK